MVMSCSSADVTIGNGNDSNVICNVMSKSSKGVIGLAKQHRYCIVGFNEEIKQESNQT